MLDKLLELHFYCYCKQIQKYLISHYCVSTQVCFKLWCYRLYTVCRNQCLYASDTQWVEKVSCNVMFFELRHWSSYYYSLLNNLSKSILFESSPKTLIWVQSNIYLHCYLVPPCYKISQWPYTSYSQIIYYFNYVARFSLVFLSLNSKSIFTILLKQDIKCKFAYNAVILKLF